ncbi:heme exporter protein CcmD [uncultured Maricaulis sp.]|uniref:heme exporter protein CcmD n=1 Tax=uncultured Maricaulis sp. TaxID=174710 RepID=UPI0030DA3D3C|tara:strand:+ start:49528 stop:49683 length:156 start_codon:yes stop_codon:yes gene_type:complete
MSDFLAMGGYAVWVWSAWGLSAAALIALVVTALAERRAAAERLHRLESDEA